MLTPFHSLRLYIVLLFAVAALLSVAGADPAARTARLPAPTGRPPAPSTSPRSSGPVSA